MNSPSEQQNLTAAPIDDEEEQIAVLSLDEPLTYRGARELNRDSTLAYFVYIANTTGAGIGITLYVNGLILTGHLISSAEYFEELANNFTQFLPEDSGFSSISEMFRNDAQEIRSDPSKLRLEDVEFLHIRLYRTYIGSRVIEPAPENLPTWRGRLSDVSGFVQGSLGNIPERTR